MVTQDVHSVKQNAQLSFRKNFWVNTNIPFLKRVALLVNSNIYCVCFRMEKLATLPGLRFW